jgi:hypothetical protein
MLFPQRLRREHLRNDAFMKVTAKVQKIKTETDNSQK